MRACSMPQLAASSSADRTEGLNLCNCNRKRLVSESQWKHQQSLRCKSMKSIFDLSTKQHVQGETTPGPDQRRLDKYDGFAEGGGAESCPSLICSATSHSSRAVALSSSTANTYSGPLPGCNFWHILPHLSQQPEA